MGVFNIIETFFFLSLAVTFILILLLVNHFKQRINVLEQKCDTMFEVINSMLQDIGNLSKVFSFSDPRIQAMHPVFTESFYANFAANNEASDRSKSNPEVVVELNDDSDEKIVVSDDEDENDDEDYSDDDEYDGDEDESDEEEEENEDEGSDPKIKIVNLDILDNKIVVETLPENGDITLEEVVDDSNDEDLEEINTEIPGIQVLKMDAVDEPSTDDNVTYEENAIINQKDVYNKMTVQELKKVVITMGLCSDASKLKKPDLLKLLEQ